MGKEKSRQNIWQKEQMLKSLDMMREVLKYSNIHAIVSIIQFKIANIVPCLIYIVNFKQDMH